MAAGTRFNDLLILPSLPEVKDASFLETLIQDQRQAPPAVVSSNEGTHPFATALLDEANSTVTANGAPAFVSTGDARLDLFSKVGAGNLQGPDLSKLLRNSWVQDPLESSHAASSTVQAERLSFPAVRHGCYTNTHVH